MSVNLPSPLFGAVEAGGTKFVCAVGRGPDDLPAVTRFPTTTPEETLARTLAFFREQPTTPVAVGVGSFGPVDPDPHSPTYGHITLTPKPRWSNVDVAGALREGLGVPVAFDTDVNAAGLGEHRWGAAQGLDTFLYLTVGTGIGGGGLAGGRPMHGLVHPEMGHIFVPRAPGDTFAGACPFHGDCLEGMASGSALEARWGRPAAELPADDPAWPLEAHYLAYGIANFILTLSPQRIIVGGGVMRRPRLLPMIRQKVKTILNGYVKAPTFDDLDAYLVPPALGDRAGVLGALAMAQELA